jgi:sporulation protein YlmC with PRC-barrel domain
MPSPAAGCRATDLIGAQIVGAHGQDVGKLSDIVFDMRHGQVAFAVITTLEDERRIAVPAAVVLAQPGRNNLTLACDEQKLRAANDFAKSDLEDPNWINSAYAYFDVTPPPSPAQEMASSQVIDEPAGAQLPAVSAQEHDKEMSHILRQYQLGKGEAHQMDNKYWNNSPAETTPPATDPLLTMPRPAPVTVARPASPVPYFIRSSDLVGCAVEDVNGHPVGDIKDAVVDWAQGRFVFAVLDPTGELSMDGRYIPIAPAALGSTPNGGALTVNVTKEALMSAPNFDRAQWPDVSDQGFIRDVYHYYHPLPD